MIHCTTMVIQNLEVWASDKEEMEYTKLNSKEEQNHICFRLFKGNLG